MRQSRIFLLLLLVGLTGCATHNPQSAPPVFQPVLPAPPQEAPRPFFSEEGLASWYGSAHKGKTTANGEHFDQSTLTGAHRSLPFNTIIRVTDLKSGKTVKVRINDRGPFVKGRIIDLSAAAAATLGLAKDGIGRVRVDAFAVDQTPN
ncbi:MAG TPA: septal ring lytic transglycosylase RlpA family protein [Rhizomicrobium sp.]|nr:septal ring lytic transglycosylase RlpA family protein [Rhizomicrobium sp.]